MVAERKKVDRLVLSQTSTPEGVPLPSYRYGKETSGTPHKAVPQMKKALMRDLIRSLSKLPDNVVRIRRIMMVCKTVNKPNL